jgi:hypothetical protein
VTIPMSSRTWCVGAAAEQSASGRSKRSAGRRYFFQ